MIMTSYIIVLTEELAPSKHETLTQCASFLPLVTYTSLYNRHTFVIISHVIITSYTVVTEELGYCYTNTMCLSKKVADMPDVVTMEMCCMHGGVSWGVEGENCGHCTDLPVDVSDVDITNFAGVLFFFSTTE